MNATGVINEEGNLSDFRAVGAQGDEKIPDEGRTLSTIEAISRSYAGKIDEAKRGEITLEETKQLADLVGSTPHRLARTILGRQRGGVIVDAEGGMGLAETMVAARTLLVNEIKVLDKLAEEAKAEGGDAALLRFRTQMEYVSQLQAQIKGSQTEIARALSSFRIPAREGGDDLAASDTNRLLEEYGGPNDIRDLADAYLQGGSIEGRAGVARLGGKFKRFSDAFYESWINQLLSNPITHSKNIAGAILTMGVHTVETAGAVGVGAARRAITGGPKTEDLGQINAQVFGMMMSMRDAFSLAGKSFMTGEKPFAGTKIDGMKGKRPAYAFSAEGMQAQGVLGTFADVMGNIMTLGRIPTRALEFEDTFFKVIAHRQKLYEEAYRTGAVKGYKGERLAEHIAQYTLDPPTSGVEAAEAHAQYITLQTKMDGAGQQLSSVRHKVPFLRYFVPFFNTPYNAFRYAFQDRTPLGLAFGESAKIIKRGMQPNASKSDIAASNLAIARMSMGTSMMLMVGQMAANGEITGAGPSDPKLRATLRRQGWQPYSIRVGDTYYSYAGGEPVTSLIGLSADAAESLMHSEVEEKQGMQVATAMAHAFSSQLTEKQFMSGFASLMSMLNDPDRYTETTVERLVGSLVPRVVSQAEKINDPVMQQTRTLVDGLRAQIPAYSETLPSRRNLWGQPIILSGALGPDIISTIFSSVAGPTGSENEMAGKLGLTNFNQRAYNLDSMMEQLSYGPTPHGDTIGFQTRGGVLGVALSPEEEERYHAYAGVRSVESLEKVMSNEGFLRLYRVATDESQTSQTRQMARERAVSELRRAMGLARDAAAKDMRDDPDFGRSIRRKIDEQANVMQTEQQLLREAL